MDDTAGRYDIGKGHLRAREFAAAATAFQRLVEQDPQDAEAWQFLGAAQSQEKNWAVALSAFRKAEALEPTARNRYNLAVALTEGLSRHDEARLYLERALETEPDHEPSHKLLAQLEARSIAPTYDPRQAQRRIQHFESKRLALSPKRRALGIFVALVTSMATCWIWFRLPIGGPLVAFGAGWLVGLLTAKACGQGGITPARIAGWTAGVFFVPLCGLLAYFAYLNGNVWSLVLNVLAMYIGVSQAYKIALNTD